MIKNLYKVFLTCTIPDFSGKWCQNPWTHQRYGFYHKPTTILQISLRLETEIVRSVTRPLLYSKIMCFYSNKRCLPELPRYALCLEEDRRRIHSNVDSGFYIPLCFYRAVFLQVWTSHKDHWYLKLNTKKEKISKVMCCDTSGNYIKQFHSNLWWKCIIWCKLCWFHVEHIATIKMYTVYENTLIHSLPPCWLCERLKYVRRRCTPHMAKTEGCSCFNCERVETLASMRQPETKI